MGKPNVGKSSLLNSLLRQERAIVTDIPGTTRDILEEELQIGEITLRIIDTAGIRETEDEVEKIGIERAKESLKQADFVMIVLDYSAAFDNNDRWILDVTKQYTGVVLINKSDQTDEKRLVSRDEVIGYTNKEVIDFSAKERLGFDELEYYLKECFYKDDLSFNDEIYLSNTRQKEALSAGIESLKKVREGIAEGVSEDLLTIDLMDALNSFGRITGQTAEEEMIDTIFREFCVGK